LKKERKKIGVRGAGGGGGEKKMTARKMMDLGFREKK
jgi:hypothetical protein